MWPPRAWSGTSARYWYASGYISTPRILAQWIQHVLAASEGCDFLLRRSAAARFQRKKEAIAATVRHFLAPTGQAASRNARERAGESAWRWRIREPRCRFLQRESQGGREKKGSGPKSCLHPSDER